MKLFCFPYAGGSASIFKQWNVSASSGMDVRPFELAGKGRRYSDSMYRSVTEAVDDILSVIGHDVQTERYALFGHSLGAKLAFEVAHEIRKRKWPNPIHLFLSGRGAPGMDKSHRKNYVTMSDAALLEEICQLGGTDQEILDSPEFVELFLPVIRNDFRIAQDDGHPSYLPLPYDITIFLGRDEEFSPNQIVSWKEHTEGTCSFHFYPGGHFFINSHYQDIINKISRSTLNR